MIACPECPRTRRNPAIVSVARCSRYVRRPRSKPVGAECGDNTVIPSSKWAFHTDRLTVSQWVVAYTSVSDRERRGDVVSENPTLREETGGFEANPGVV